MSDNEFSSTEPSENKEEKVMLPFDDADDYFQKQEYPEPEYTNSTNDEQRGDDDEGPSRQKYIKTDNHTKIVASHYNSIEEKGLDVRNKSKILYMRNFNNWVKSMLINEYLSKIKSNLQLGAPLRVMDMCCGKGGDLYKWQKGNFDLLLF